ncbi:MAG: asparagine synthase (glutamine-hydrolyzing) [Nitrospinae bacterium]|nr:asparagine synthase (glutamine-hydrolyzing) [Nitrospinota bacterium]
MGLVRNMCGICGITSTELSPSSIEAGVARMCDAMTHRGPDDAGLWRFGATCIGVRRLSVIDPSSAAKQPMTSEDGRICVALNGEIYNFKRLKEHLASRGHAFRSRSDTEVLLRLYEEKGDECARFLRGMFAFAIMDAGRRVLLLTRDRLGVKPLYYAPIAGGWAFASELGALVRSGVICPELDLNALDLSLSMGFVPGPRTLLKGVKVLPPGHRMRITKSEASIERWWKMPMAGTTRCADEEILPRLRGLLEESVELHQISDVPLGVFLSGGLDSSTVVGLMSHQADRPVRTYSVGFDDAPEGYDERRYARTVAQSFSTRHTEFVLQGSKLVEELPRIIRHLDQPSFDGVNTYYVSQMAKQDGVTVALSGLGADELFGGYDTFRFIPRWWRWSTVWGKLPLAARKTLVTLVALMLPFGPNMPLERIEKFRRLQWVESPLGLYALARLLLWPEEKRALYSPELQVHFRGWKEDEDILTMLDSLVRVGERPWSVLSELEMQVYMGWRTLRDTDTMSMAHSLEVRVPFVDHHIVEFVCGLPPGWERRWGHPKRLLEASLRNVIPPEISTRRKQGFALPMAKWMRGDLREILEDVLSEESLRRRGIFSPNEVRRRYARFQEGGSAYPLIWFLAVLELWFREMLDAHR